MDFNYTATWHCFKSWTATLIDGTSIMPMRLVELTEELQKHFFKCLYRYCFLQSVHSIEKSQQNFINTEKPIDIEKG